MSRPLLPGRPYPLGAKCDKRGVNFAVYSENATGVEVCLFDEQHNQTDSFMLSEQTAFVWHRYVPGLREGQLYGLRAHGPWEPKKGLRFNPAKLLVDPYAEAICGEVDWSKAVFPYAFGGKDADLKIEQTDNAAGMPKGVVINHRFDWGDDEPPATPLADSVIYEVHVKGFSKLNPGVPEKLRGTYAGLACDASIEHLKKLGVTAVEIMPIHQFVDDKRLVDRGLRNYWGYDTLAYLALESRYSSSGTHGEQVREFKEMVKRLHQNGIEVILDVVYNHTCEGNEMGPMFSLKGIDNTTYYRTVTDNPRYYMDYTGTGNTLNVLHPQVLKLIMDSLRYWVTEMHVDGFRFDLAATLARSLHEVDRLSSFFNIIQQDPTIADVKLIAEPWDVGEGGYQVGNFPVLWAEWNGKYRDTVRRYWKGDDGQLSDLGYRLTGSSDLYKHDGRRPYASINFITAHDGFTLNDLVSYNDKHNEANGEDNNDGANDNSSWNMGAEGPTDDTEINHARLRQMRNMMATLMLSQGVPMISGGDEVARTQNGNNNAYCQDDEISWTNWDLDERRKNMLEFTSRMILLRREHQNLHRAKFFQDREIRNSKGHDIAWYGIDGRELPEETWSLVWVRTLGLMLNGRTLNTVDVDGNPIVDDSFLILLNAHHEPIDFQLPETLAGGQWQRIVNTDDIENPFAEEIVGEKINLAGRSLVLLKEIAKSAAPKKQPKAAKKPK